MDSPTDRIPDLMPPLDPPVSRFDWEWSAAARAAFFAAASGGQGRMRVSEGLNAALDVDGPMILASALDRLVVNMANHPTLGQRVLQLKAQPDGTLALPIDEDLIRLVLFNTLPDQVGTRWESEAAAAETKDD